MKDYYSILSVNRNADEVVIKAAYKALAQKYHPDKSENVSRVKNLGLMQEINEAYSILGDNQKRMEDDRKTNPAEKQTAANSTQTTPRRTVQEIKKEGSRMLEGILLAGCAILLLWIVIFVLNLF